MACIELFCSRCNWQEFTNKVIKVCPLCHTKVKSFFDEAIEIDDKEKPYETTENNL